MSDRTPLKGIASRWARRSYETARAGASLGVVAAKTAAQAVRTLEDEVEGDAFADRLDALKGLSMKVGQMLSYLDGAVPASTQAALKRLQHNSRPMDWEVVDILLREEYGRDPHEVFDEIEHVPFAAASIGQVHRGRVGDRDVAIKVQYPEIAKAISVDLDNVGSFARVASIGSAVASQPLVAELRARLHEEVDYRQEGAQQALFRQLYADEPGVVVPEVFESLVRDRVLVTGFVGGYAFDDFAERASPEARNAAALAMWRVIWRSIYHHGLFNGDPHPGNYRFRPTGEVALLDFGCVRSFDAEFLDRWKAFARSVRAGDRDGFPDHFRSLGFVGSSRYDFDATWAFIQYLYEPMLTPGFRFTREFAARGVALGKANPNKLKTAMPPEWLLLNRLQWGLFSVLARLDAAGDFGAAFWEAVDSPTAPIARPPRLA